MLTIFAIPKPFQGQNEIIQRNAVHSWSLLRPTCEIVLCGDEPGTGEVAVEFGAKFLPNISRNKYGTPLLNSAFDQASQVACYRLLCYVNADIILVQDFIEAVKRIQFPRFLMVGRRWNIDLNEPWDFKHPEWKKRLRHYLSLHGEPHPSEGGIDYFVFPRKMMIGKMLPFAVGRPAWDHWFIYLARKELGIPVIDASRVTKAIHQNHDYCHVLNRRDEKWEGPEGDQNIELMDHLDQNKLRLRDATHIITPDALLPSYKILIREHGYIEYIRWSLLHTLPILVPKTKPLIRLLILLAKYLRGSNINYKI